MRTVTRLRFCCPWQVKELDDQLQQQRKERDSFSTALDHLRDLVHRKQGQLRCAHHAPSGVHRGLQLQIDCTGQLLCQDRG